MHTDIYIHYMVYLYQRPGEPHHPPQGNVLVFRGETAADGHRHSGLRVFGLGLRVSGLGFGVLSAGFRVAGVSGQGLRGERPSESGSTGVTTPGSWGVLGRRVRGLVEGSFQSI